MCDHMCPARLPTLRDGEGIEGPWPGPGGLSQHQGHLVHCQPTGARSKQTNIEDTSFIVDWHCNEEILIMKLSTY